LQPAKLRAIDTAIAIRFIREPHRALSTHGNPSAVLGKTAKALFEELALSRWRVGPADAEELAVIAPNIDGVAVVFGEHTLGHPARA